MVMRAKHLHEIVNSVALRPSIVTKLSEGAQRAALCLHEEAEVFFSRRVSDDKLAVTERRVYLYKLSDASDEQDKLTEVFKCKTHMPDDMVKTPVWSPDSQKIAFFSFEQDPALIKIFEASVAGEKKSQKEKDSQDKSTDNTEDKEQDEAAGDDDEASETLMVTARNPSRTCVESRSCSRRPAS